MSDIIPVEPKCEHHSFSPQSSIQMSVKDLFMLHIKGAFIAIEDWVRLNVISGNNRKDHPYHWALILSYEVARVLQNLYYEWQGRRKYDHDQKQTDCCDILAMSMALVVDSGCDLHKTMQIALEKFEGKPEYKRAFHNLNKI